VLSQRFCQKLIGFNKMFGKSELVHMVGQFCQVIGRAETKGNRILTSLGSN
jgi:hypothetical protein